MQPKNCVKMLLRSKEKHSCKRVRFNDLNQKKYM